MRVDILTLFPDAFAGPLDVSIIKRAREDGLLALHIHDIRNWATDRHRTVDDYPFGGGHGMVMKVDVLDAALTAVQASAEPPGHVIFLSPQGERLTDGLVRELARFERLVLVCGRYEGVDERFVERCVDREVSIGDFILTGGELPAMVLVDAVTRHVPGALGDDASPQDESFADDLLEHPQYTRPAEYRGWKVPDVLLSGHHANIEKWKAEQRLERTRSRRPDLLDKDKRDEEAPSGGWAAYPGVSRPRRWEETETSIDLRLQRQGRSWRIGTPDDVSWIAGQTTMDFSITSAIPPVFEAYATFFEPQGVSTPAHERAVIAQLLVHTLEQPWWLGYLETGAHDVVFEDAPRVLLYSDWPYVLVEAGPEQALEWRAGHMRAHDGALPDLLFPADRSWLVSALWDDTWTCIGGPETLIDALVADPLVQARRVQPGEDATPPGRTRE